MGGRKESRTDGCLDDLLALISLPALSNPSLPSSAHYYLGESVTNLPLPISLLPSPSSFSDWLATSILFLSNSVFFRKASLLSFSPSPRGMTAVNMQIMPSSVPYDYPPAHSRSSSYSSSAHSASRPHSSQGSHSRIQGAIPPPTVEEMYRNPHYLSHQTDHVGTASFY